MDDLHSQRMETDIVASTTTFSWACPRCHVDLPTEQVAPGSYSLPLEVRSRVVHSSASLEKYAQSCPNCGLQYTATGVKSFEYPYRQLLAGLSPKRFLRWSAAQNNGYISYAMMRDASCSVDGRPDVAAFSAFIARSLTTKPHVIVDLGCGPQSQPAYLPSLPGATLVGVDPFESQWSGPFVHGAGEFLPLQSGSVDLVIAATALDHTLDLRRALQEIARVTKAGGGLVVWDHTFPRKRDRIVALFGTLLLPRFSWEQKMRQVRSALPERVRIYDNGIVLWTPEKYADPFHEPRSRRPSWTRLLQKQITKAGYTMISEDRSWGFSHYVCEDLGPSEG